MKKYMVLFFFAAAVVPGGYAENGRLDIKRLFAFQYERPRKPSPERLSIVHFILKNTRENNIHKMRGETGNRVYANQDGREVVFDETGKQVTNSYNCGTFNYGSYEQPAKKFLLDIAPWLERGTGPGDPTSFGERLFHYTLDLDHGIQAYIFEGANKTLETVPFSKLSADEKEVYYIFLRLIFNESYAIGLNESALPRLKSEGSYYYQYFSQIQAFLGFKD